MRPEHSPADQAHGLRRAFRREGMTVLPVCASGHGAHAQGWVVHFAAALAERGRRVLVLDADGGRIAPALGLKARLELRHLLEGECTFEEAILPAGPNLAVLPGARGLEMFVQSGEAPATLFGALRALPSPPDVLIASGPVERVAPLVAPGEEVVFVVGPSDESVTGAYAAIKRAERDCPGRLARVAPVGVADLHSGEALGERLARATARFLNRRPVFAHPVRDDPMLAECARAACSLIERAPDCAAAEDFRTLADAFDRWQTALHDSTFEG